MHLIFDFDGTLVDSFHAVVETFNLLAHDFHFQKTPTEKINELRNLSSKDLIRYFKIPVYKIPVILHQARQHLQNKMHQLTPFPTIPEILHDLAAAGFSLGIVTSNAEENVISWLNQQNLKKYFDFIHSGSNYLGKTRILKKIMKHHKIETACYIGDETRDIEAAKQCNILSMAVTWGFNSEEILSQYQPDYIAHTPQDILNISLKLI